MIILYINSGQGAQKLDFQDCRLGFMQIKRVAQSCQFGNPANLLSDPWGPQILKKRKKKQKNKTKQTNKQTNKQTKIIVPTICTEPIEVSAGSCDWVVWVHRNTPLVTFKC